MTNWKRKSLNTGLIFASLYFFSTLAGANSMAIVKYNFSFKSKKSTCLLRINDLPTIDNTTIPSGTMSAGFNITPYLENGANRIELLMGPQDNEDPKTLFPDSSCEVVLSKDDDGVTNEMSAYKLIVNDKGGIAAFKSSIENNVYNQKVVEGYAENDNDYGLYKVRGDVVIEGLPTWSWINARPVTELDLHEIRKAYVEMAGLIKLRDIEKLKEITKIANQEIAFTQGVSADLVFSSTDLPAHVMDKSFTLAPINWDEQKLKTYSNGRLFRLGAGFFQISPLQFINQDGEISFAWNPYLSIINGKITVVR